MNYLFRSERLGFRNWKDTDVPEMTRISSDPEVMRFFPAPATPQQTSEFIVRMKNEYEKRGFCYFAVDDLESGRLIGFIGLLNQTYEAEFTPCVDIGWRLDKVFWNKGYATEGAKKCLEYAFFDLGLEKIIATAPQVNLPSINVMEKLGMSRKLEFQHPRLKTYKELSSCVCYEIGKIEVENCLTRSNPIPNPS